jgi:hypothetical protein
VARLVASATDRHIRRGALERQRVLWPQPSPVRRPVLTALGLGLVFIQETWALNVGAHCER